MAEVGDSSASSQQLKCSHERQGEKWISLTRKRVRKWKRRIESDSSWDGYSSFIKMGHMNIEEVCVYYWSSFRMDPRLRKLPNEFFLSFLFYELAYLLQGSRMLSFYWCRYPGVCCYRARIDIDKLYLLLIGWQLWNMKPNSLFGDHGNTIIAYVLFFFKGL